MSAINATTVIADLLAAGHAVRFRAEGDSMWPLIHSGDFLLVEPVNVRDLVRGDVVLALQDRGLTAHRVVHIARDAKNVMQITTRGDNAPKSDDSFEETRVLGLVRHAERDARQYSINRYGSIFSLTITRLWVRTAARFDRLFSFSWERV
ncbi:MAG TPA: S24/S26 family peptidase [Thermoanaerobaculia bacterium]|nr:S24/S26 family peptidase [Thermoanaerobaculia bacterium]